MASAAITPNTSPANAGGNGSPWLEALVARGGLVLFAAALFVFLTVPLAAILIRSLQDRAGEFVGLVNFSTYFQSPALAASLTNTALFALLTTIATVPLAFGFAYAIQRSCIPARALWRNIALIPILAPSLLAARSFLYLFGNQGWLNFMLAWFGLAEIYGLPGMVLSMTFASFPHALMILLAALALADGRLYEAADSLGTSRARRFWTVTLPGAKYGLLSATLVVFTMAVSEFGVPKIIGGNTSVLALDIYGFAEAGIDNAYYNSLELGASCAVVGAILTFSGAYWIEKTRREMTRGVNLLRGLIQFQAMLPMAVPGMVLGIGYILFFNAPGNPLNVLYGTMTVLVTSTVMHFYSASHLTAVTALKQLDTEFESVSASLKVPFYRTFWRVTVPVCLPAVIDISRY